MQTIDSQLPMQPVRKNTWGTLLGGILLILLLRTFVISPFKIPSGSMIPTLLVGDHVMVSKYAYGWSNYSLFFSGYINYFSGRIGTFKPKRGDVAVFAYPVDKTKDYIKRIVGLPGDKIQMIDGYLYINDAQVPLEKVSENYQSHDSITPIQGTIYEETLPGKSGKKHLILKQLPFGQATHDNTPPIIVPEDHYFVLGDNRDGSSDSRISDQLGTVHKDYFIGPALFLFFSWDMPTWGDLLKFWEIPMRIRYGRIFNKIQ